MLTNETRRNILNRVKASGYPGGVSEAFRAAEQGVDVVDQFVKQQQQEQQQQQEMQASQQQMQGNEGMSQRESSPPPPPMNRPDGRISPPNVNQPIDNNQGHLVQSENTQNVGIQSLPTGSAQGQVIQAKNGGVRKYATGGPNDNSNEELEEAYEQYTLNKDMEDDIRSEEGGSNHSSSISYNKFKKIASTQGIDVASQYFSKENGKVTSEVNEDYFNREAMKNQSLGTVRSWSPANQKAYYEKLASKNSMMSASDFRSLDDEKLKAQNTTTPAPGFESELSLEQQKILATPDTFKEKGAWSAGNLANFGREWDHSDRVVSGDSGIGNYYFGGGTENTYKPSYSYGTDAKTDKAFFADTKGNPVGTHYKDGTPYSKELMSRNSYGGGDKKLSMLDDGSKLKERYDFADKVMYNYIPSAVAAVGSLGGTTALTRTAAKPIVRYGTQAVNSFKNMLAPLGQGTSNIYRARQGFSGLYNTAKAVSVPQIYNTSANQLGTEVRGQGNYQNRLNTVAKVTDVIPALSWAKEGIKIGSDIANNDYLSAGTRGATMLIPGFTKSKQFGTSVKHHALKLANSYINTKPSPVRGSGSGTQFRDGGVRYSRRRMGYVSRNIL